MDFQTGTVAKDAECGKTKGCYSDCSGSSCNFLMTWAPGSSADRALITLAAPVGSPSGRYIAFGLSDDSKMVSAVLASWWIMLQWVD